ncbi:hypothetical protein AB4099_31445 [Bosea sp. 2KB_26]|uniref:hypothetical protein n=1 Tax=Bosea sp. 2KB_26 TaxID=3237475 RepID=UPI003F8EEA01
MDEEWLSRLEQRLIGRCGSIERREWDWALNLAGGGVISLPIPWRIVANGRIAFAGGDDGQQFGLPAPVDGEALVNGILDKKVIVGVAVDRETADLSIRFEDAVRLDAFNYSAGYEGWQVNLPAENGGLWVIALGGGDVEIFA